VFQLFRQQRKIAQNRLFLHFSGREDRKHLPSFAAEPPYIRTSD
jgi:hypothetical protein